MDNVSELAVMEETAVDELGVRPGDLAVLGDFSGIPGYVLGLEPVTGALDRIRARSFKVNAYAWLIARRIQQDLVPGMRAVNAAGGRFLLAGPARPTAEPILISFQRNLDEWTFRQLRGELQVHLAVARCEGESLPIAALESKLAARRLRPLEGALLQGAYWNATAFWNAATASGLDRCESCGSTETVHSGICFSCLEDQELGQGLSQVRFARAVAENVGRVSIPGLGMALGETGDLDLTQGEWPLFRYSPAPSLEALAELSPGRRKLLGCLVLDADQSGRALSNRNGDSGVLSRRLHEFFSIHLQRLIEARFPDLYPIHGGGDDLLVIGRWDQALDLAVELRKEAATALGTTVSGALGLAHPCARLDVAANDAWRATKLAKAGSGDRFSLFGSVMTWDEAGKLAEQTQWVARWLRDGRLPGDVLRRVAELRRLNAAGQDGWRLRSLALLAGQARKVASAEVRDWIHRLGGSAEWLRMELLAEMALLAAGERADTWKD